MRKHSDQIHEYTFHSLQGYSKLFRGGAWYNIYSILRISMPFDGIDRMIDLKFRSIVGKFLLCNILITLQANENFANYTVRSIIASSTW